MTKTREVVLQAACNKCHDQLSAHGGARRDLQLCITCHSPQSVDPDTGNTVDLSVMVHKIHMGSSLPSVVAGLVHVPVIAVPTSIGYGASFGGIAALLGMLNSCANGVAVVNIDNGFGAGCMASLINHL